MSVIQGTESISEGLYMVIKLIESKGVLEVISEIKWSQKNHDITLHNKLVAFREK